MTERMRWAIDVTGRRFPLVERAEFIGREQPSDASEPKFLTRDGQPLIDEGDGFFRNPFGGCYKLVD